MHLPDRQGIYVQIAIGSGMGGKIGEMLKGGRGGAPLLFQRRQRRVQDSYEGF
jgi:hypothetical protein